MPLTRELKWNKLRAILLAILLDVDASLEWKINTKSSDLWSEIKKLNKLVDTFCSKKQKFMITNSLRKKFHRL